MWVFEHFPGKGEFEYYGMMQAEMKGRREVAVFWDSFLSSFRLKNPNHHLDLQLVSVITAKLNVQHCGTKQYIAVTNC